MILQSTLYSSAPQRQQQRLLPLSPCLLPPLLPGPPSAKEYNGNNKNVLLRLRTLRTLPFLKMTPLTGALAPPPAPTKGGVVDVGGVQQYPPSSSVVAVIATATTQHNHSTGVSAPPAPLLPSSFSPGLSLTTLIVPLILILFVIRRRCRRTNTGTNTVFLFVVVVFVLVFSSSFYENEIGNDNGGSFPNSPFLSYCRIFLM